MYTIAIQGTFNQFSFQPENELEYDEIVKTKV